MVKVLSVGQVLVLGSNGPFLCVNHYENQNIKFNRNKSTLRFCRQSPWCVGSIFAVTNDDLWQPEGVYI